MSTELNQPAITARIIPNNRRMAFLPRLFGAWYLTGEAGVYNLARSLCVDYQGGSWEFVETVFCKNGDITNPELSGGKMPDAGRNMTWDLRAPAPTPSHLRATVAIKGSFRGAEF
ncbi:hypothetical protein AAY798_27350 [Klebsiella quasipneumoniae]|uniref:hypothetical protein n=1 Tax=Enterobacterales TaxID=91347 RepID=UPI00311AE33D